MQLQSKLVYRAIFLVLAIAAPLAVADEPTSQPTTAPATGDPEIKVIQNLLAGWDKTMATDSLQDVRKCYYTENDREARYCDRMAHEAWETGKTQQVVRDKWGLPGEVRLAHIVSATTREEDQAAAVEINQNHATASWTVQYSDPLLMIKVDGKWMIDGHAIFQKQLANNDNFDKEPSKPYVKLLHQAVADINADKFDDLDSFISDFKIKYDSLSSEN